MQLRLRLADQSHATQNLGHMELGTHNRGPVGTMLEFQFNSPSCQLDHFSLPSSSPPNRPIVVPADGKKTIGVSSMDQVPFGFQFLVGTTFTKGQGVAKKIIDSLGFNSLLSESEALCPQLPRRGPGWGLLMQLPGDE